MQIIGQEKVTLGYQIVNDEKVISALDSLYPMKLAPMLSSLAVSHTSLGKVILEKYRDKLDSNSLRYMAVYNSKLKDNILSLNPKLADSVDKQLEFTQAFRDSDILETKVELSFDDLSGISALYESLDTSW